MMISQPALLCIEATWQRILGRSVTVEVQETAPAIRREPSAGAATIDGDHTEIMQPVMTVVQGDADAELATAPAPGAPLTAAERRARAAALRGLALSRARRFDAARTAFSEASRLDPTLDLTRTPAFWKLERSAHEAAIAAYVETGRDGDAAILRARVHSTFRPKAIRPRPGPVLSS